MDGGRYADAFMDDSIYTWDGRQPFFPFGVRPGGLCVWLSILIIFPRRSFAVFTEAIETGCLDPITKVAESV